VDFGTKASEKTDFLFMNPKNYMIWMSRLVGGPLMHPDKANNIPANTRSSTTNSSFFMISLQKEKALPDLVDEESKGPTFRRLRRHIF